MESKHKYFAFISYNSRDIKWGKRLQHKLEHYRMPATLFREHGWERTPIKPVFFAPTDIQPGGLSQELQERLKGSRNLIVICSPNSARSEWVGREITFFHELGRTQNIHFFIVEGEPHSGNPDTECFNPVVETLGMPEILGANIHERIHRLPWLNRERAYVQLISKLLNVEFDTIWKRHRRQLARKTVAWAMGGMAVVAALAGVWAANQPVDVTLRVNEISAYNPALPAMRDATVTMVLDNKTETDTLRNIDDQVTFRNIPHRYLNRPVQVTLQCRDFLPIDTTLTLTKEMTVDVARDPTVYGNIYFRLWNPEKETTVANETVNILGFDAVSDESGIVSLTIPLEMQQKFYPVSASVPLAYDTIHMPCGKDDVILTK